MLEQSRPQVLYTIHEENGNAYTTEDPELAEEYSRNGLRVTAEVSR